MQATSIACVLLISVLAMVMMDEPDPFEVLGVDKDADMRAVRKAYRKLSLIYHPDVYGSNRAEIDRLQGMFVKVDHCRGL